MTKDEKIKSEELLSKLRLANISVRKNYPNVELVDSNLGVGLTTNQIQKLIDENVPYNFIVPHNHFFGYCLKWKSVLESGVEANGSVKIMNLHEIFQDWKGQTYFDNTPEDNIFRDFKIVDFFYDEYACGILFGKQKDFTFYYGELNGSGLKSLDLDINGYIEMMIYSKGYSHWQTGILDLLYGYNLANLTEMKENMPKLFPDWNWEGYVQKFDELRLHKVK